jgi:hypothetical protein
VTISEHACESYHDDVCDTHIVDANTSFVFRPINADSPFVSLGDIARIQHVQTGVLCCCVLLLFLSCVVVCCVVVCCVVVCCVVVCCVVVCCVVVCCVVVCCVVVCCVVCGIVLYHICHVVRCVVLRLCCVLKLFVHRRQYICF